MAHRLTIPTSVGEVGAVLALPAGAARGAGVAILHEWWGVNEQIEVTAQRWADEGFAALVPDLYHGKVAQTAAEAEALMTALDSNRAVQEIRACVEHLRGHARSTGKLAVTGYCLGGALAFRTAVFVRGLAAVVPFYGVPAELDWSQVDAPIQAHFAQHDDWATVAKALRIKERVPVAMELHVYDAKHAFCNERRPDVYDAAAAQLAWDRTVSFVRSHTAA
jgi:carboxymethylenebutenolidase